MKILISNKQKSQKITIKDFQRIAIRLIKAMKLPKSSVLSLVFCDDKLIQSINKQHRDKDEPTDVLSFPMPRNEFDGGSGAVVLGDIVISVETAQRQASELKHSLKSEIAFLMIHGMLHLNGYDHIDDNDRVSMSAKEAELYKMLCRAGLIHDLFSVSSAVISRTEK